MEIETEPHLFPDLAANAGEDHEGPSERAEPELATIPDVALGDVLSGGESRENGQEILQNCQA